MMLMQAKAVFGLAGLVAIATVLWLAPSGGNTAHVMTFQKLEETNMAATSMGTPVAPVPEAAVAPVPEAAVATGAEAVPPSLASAPLPVDVEKAATAMGAPVAPVAEAAVAPVAAGAEVVAKLLAPAPLVPDVEKVSEGETNMAATSMSAPVAPVAAAAVAPVVTGAEAVTIADVEKISQGDVDVLAAKAAAAKADASAMEAHAVAMAAEVNNNKTAAPTVDTSTKSPEETELQQKTLGTLKAQLAQVQEQTDAKLLVIGMKNATQMRSEETKTLKAEVHTLKTQAKALKDAVRDKKAAAPHLLKTLAGEEVMHRSEQVKMEQHEASKAACVALSGKWDEPKVYCCATSCNAGCGIKSKKLAEGEADVCSRQVIKASKVCATGGDLPCMMRYIPSEESKVAAAAYDAEQAVVIDESALVVNTQTSEEPWYTKVADWFIN
jgi:hypothetical protein